MLQEFMQQLKKMNKKMNKLAVIGGTGLSTMDNLKIIKEEVVDTPYGAPSAPLIHGELSGQPVIFLPRHGSGHTLPPHKINYRANIWALKSAGITHIVAVAAVGGIPSHFVPKTLVVPDQIIDYTTSRINTYFEEGLSEVTHIDFSEPYCEDLRGLIFQVCDVLNIDVEKVATYAATEGPRLETAAEINRLDRDGCHIVGMTGMPEAALARELEMCYSTFAVVANLAAGRSEEALTMELITAYVNEGMAQTRNVIEELIKKIN
jgi:5'-deoxy-5'-methylthioadenosine phosphorylase